MMADLNADRSSPELLNTLDRAFHQQSSNLQLRRVQVSDHEIRLLARIPNAKICELSQLPHFGYHGSDE
jgi:hypothetical protein